MTERSLQAGRFAAYPTQAQALAVQHVATLEKLPLSFLPVLLRELIDYDFRFPVEKKAMERELAVLDSLKPAQFDEWFGEFSKISLSSRLEEFDWINRPGQFVEQESAYLWSTHQLDAFRQAATDYGNRLNAAIAAEPSATPRLSIAIIGQGVAAYDGKLFANLRAHGTYFAHIKPDRGLEQLLSLVAERAKAHPEPYAHWYVDGGQEAAHDPSLACVSYQGLEPTRTALLKYMQTEIAKPGMGPEELRTELAQIQPADLGVKGTGDAVMDRFQLKLFTEGSGTQIFSTTFAQWAAREALRRAQPLTLLTRFAPRQRQKPMNELLSPGRSSADLDPEGSLVDADMAAYYQWINLQRLLGSERSVFLAWFEGQSQALLIAPSFPRGTESTSAMDLKELLSLAIG
jgi:hypothetical protein